MAIFNYSRFKIIIDPKSKKVQGLQLGDIVRRQYFDSPNQIYSLMIVTSIGKEMISDEESSYFIGALIEGDEPQSGELLDFVRVTNLFNADRSGALYLTASDSEAPYMDVIEGLAIDNSLCYPTLSGGLADNPDKTKYACVGDEFVTTLYKERIQEADRVFRITKNAKPNTSKQIGFKQSIEKQVENPQRIIISYKIRASKTFKNVSVSFGYTSLEEMDGITQIDITQQWEYKLHLITIDYPKQYQRSFLIDLTDYLKLEGDWCEIGDLNIVLQSDISTFAGATKARVGKIKGVVDPVFGVLEGYGAYFQNLYATKNVNIAGTLTAGDENGFSSTFYVGKIHKNVILNSIDCPLEGAIEVQDKTPVGIGKVWQAESLVSLLVQSADWRNSHIGQRYCFSVWIKSNNTTTISFYQDYCHINDITIEGTDWRRYHLCFPIRESSESKMYIQIEPETAEVIIAAPQLEFGTTPSQYQPTDGRLSYVEDYGAWFNKGGIGGTIQNPLLKLNENGSISSRDNSFLINPDGTGHFASGRFTWSKDTITLQDVTIKWESFDDEIKQNLQPVVLDIFSQQGFTIKNNSNNVTATAKLLKGGEEIDMTGMSYTYNWKLWNYAGTTVVKTFIGKTIIVPKSDVSEQGVLECEISVRIES